MSNVERNEEVCSLRRKGVGVREISRRMGITEPAVAAILRRAGLARKRLAKEERKALLAKVGKMRDQGMIRKDIAGALGISLNLAETLFAESRPGPTPIKRRAVLVNGVEYESPAEAAENYGWKEEYLVKGLANGAEVLGVETIALADAEFERIRIQERGEDVQEERAMQEGMAGY